jgi:plasmid stabilization system protein ParE
MKYRVVLRPTAERDLDEAADWIAKRAPQGSVRWFNGFIDAIQSLDTMPERYGMAPEARRLGIPCVNCSIEQRAV